MIVIWIAAIVVFGIVEAVTVGLVLSLIHI